MIRPSASVSWIALVVAASFGVAAQTVDPQAAYARAMEAFGRGVYGEALDAFAEATAAGDPGLVRQARKGRIRAALRVAEFDVARTEAERLVADDGASDGEALALHGDALWGSGLFDEGEDAYRRALDLIPDSARAHLGLARALASRSRLDEALDAALAARAQAPDDADVHAITGSVQERMLRYEDAAAGYEGYASRLPPGEAVAIATARSRAAFLRSFRDRAPLSMRERDRDTVYRVRFKLIKNKIVVPGRVNGVSVDFVVDTGAERVGISGETAGRANVRPITASLTAGVGPATWRRVALARVDSLEVGSLRMRHVPVSVRPRAVRGAPRWLGETLSPLALGMSVAVDYQAREIVLARTLPAEPADITLPLRVHRLPLVRGQLNGEHPLSFVVDTGGEMMSVSNDAVQVLGPQPARPIRLRVFGLAGLDETAFLWPGLDLQIQELSYRKVGLAVLNLRAPSVLLGFQVGGILGHKFLADYRVAIDAARGELRLDRIVKPPARPPQKS